MGDFLSKNIGSILALSCVAISFAILGALVLRSDDEKIIFAVISILSITINSIIGFYFGSSAGSAQKSRALESQLKNIKPCNNGNDGQAHG